MQRQAALEARDIGELALRFTLSLPAVSTVIPGMRSTKNVELNLLLCLTEIAQQKISSQSSKSSLVRDFYH